MISGLSAAVPLWLYELDQEPDQKAKTDRIVQWAADGATAVAHRGDVLMYGSKKEPGTAAAVFNQLAKGLAALSNAPGGIRFLGVLFCARHYRGGLTTRPAANVCPDCLAEEG